LTGCGSTKYYKITDTSNEMSTSQRGCGDKEKRGVVIFKDAQKRKQDETQECSGLKHLTG
jgi:hypothetical protein